MWNKSKNLKNQMRPRIMRDEIQQFWSQKTIGWENMLKADHIMSYNNLLKAKDILTAITEEENKILI